MMRALTLILVPGLAHAAETPGVGAGSFAQVLLGLGVVLALVIGVAWLLKRVTPNTGGAGKLLRVVGGAALGARERVMLVEIGDTWLVVGVAPGRVSALHTLPKMESASPAEPPKNFPAWLRQIAEKRNNA